MLAEFIKNTCHSLESNGIQYMISGSIAANVYSIPRMTRDIDIVVELYLNSVENFTSIFQNAYCDAGMIKEAIRQQGMFNIIDHQTGFKIDFIIKKYNEYSNEAFSRRKRNFEFGTWLWFVSIEDLIISKLIWIQEYESEQQKNDIRNLLMNPDIDFDYIKKWCCKMNLKNFNLL